MPLAESRRPLEELAQLGANAFEHHVRPNLKPEDDGKFVAIDVVTGEYEMDLDDYTAVMRLRARQPSDDIWLARVGQPAGCKLRFRP